MFDKNGINILVIILVSKTIPQNGTCALFFEISLYWT